ncbi:hypothetical protein NAI70_10390, partial [Francisella tularensis subsp. holarctica]|nr:hypothetical protein [Francisella tularensis subsp. holarctica]
CIGLIIGTAVFDGQDTLMILHLQAVAVFFVLMSICQVLYTIIEYRYSSRLNKIPLILRRIAILITIAFSIWSVFMDQTSVNHNIV